MNGSDAVSGNRREFIQASAVGAAALASVSTRASGADPFAPAEPGLVKRWFDKNRQHVLPRYAFATTYPAVFPPTHKPIATRTWEQLSGGPTRVDPEAPFLSLGDDIPIGKVFHGTAVEWNGKLIGGNKKCSLSPTTNEYVWQDAQSAWDAMRSRVQPEQPAFLVRDLGNWGKFGRNRGGSTGRTSSVRCYKVEVKEILKKLHPSFRFPTLLYSYQGLVPGPTFRFRHGMPSVVRFENNLQTEISVHQHGGHNPTHSDGFPTFYVLQGEARDYFYPNILPLRQNGDRTEIDFGEGQSTSWYHDHALDATAFNVAHGLSGLALYYDELELGLIRQGVLPGLVLRGTAPDGTAKVFSISSWDPDISTEAQPLEEAWAEFKRRYPNSPMVARHDRELLNKNAADPGVDPDLDFRLFYKETLTPYYNPYDIGLVLQDRVISEETSQIVYDSDGHNGYIGNVQLVNGTPWPTYEVKSRKYRLRILDGSNARIYRLRFLDSSLFALRPTGDPGGEVQPVPIPANRLASDSMDFLRIGKDSWLWPMPQRRKEILLNMANRADLIVDFAAWYKAAKDAGRLVNGNAEYYLVNTMPQFDGRGPKGKLNEDAGDPTVFPLPFALNPANPIVQNMVQANVLPPTLFAPGPTTQLNELDQPIGLVKFVITPDIGEGEEATIDDSTILRPRHRIKDEEVLAVRELTFERGNGAWMVNGRFYDPTISNATPVNGVKGQKCHIPGNPELPKKRSLEYAEEWILRNGGGGWWHPIHIHLEAHQLVGYEKDFLADGLEGLDAPAGAVGFPGGPAQANLRPLPPWRDLVGRFGLDTLNAGNALDTIERVLTRPELADLDPDYVRANPLVQIVLEDETAAAGLFPEILNGPTYKQALEALSGILQQRVVTIVTALDEVRKSWTIDFVGNHDTQALGPNTVARIRMRFRTFAGPVVLHCHNVEHEDMRMMINMESAISGLVNEDNLHDPNISPGPRSHGQDVTDLETNPDAIGELPWDPADVAPGFRWPEKPIPGISVTQAGDPLIKPRQNKKDH